MVVENHLHTQWPYTAQTNYSWAEYCPVCFSVFTKSHWLFPSLPYLLCFFGFLWSPCSLSLSSSAPESSCAIRNILIFWLKSKYLQKCVCETESESKREIIFCLHCVIWPNWRTVLILWVFNVITLLGGISHQNVTLLRLRSLLLFIF